MNTNSVRFNSKPIIVTSLIALILTFLITADKIAQLDNLTVLLTIWSIPVVQLLFTVIRDLIMPKMKNKSTKFKPKNILITSFVVVIISVLITADKIAQLENLGVLLAIWSIPAVLLLFTVIRDLIVYKIKNKASWIVGMIVLPLPTAILYAFKRKQVLLNLE